MADPKPRWFCLADARSCRLLKAEPQPVDRWRIEEIDKLENQWEDYHQTGRPKALSAQAERGGAPSFASRKHEDREERHRFAKDAVKWLDKHLKAHDIDDLQLYAAASMIGQLRDVAGKDLWKHMTEHEADLNSIPTPDLVKHPAIQSTLAKT